MKNFKLFIFIFNDALFVCLFMFNFSNDEILILFGLSIIISSIYFVIQYKENFVYDLKLQWLIDCILFIEIYVKILIFMVFFYEEDIFE